VTHIWYFKGVPSRLGYLLDLTPKELERIIYFAAYVITRVDEDRRHKDMPAIEKELDDEKREIEADRDDRIKRLVSELEARQKELEAEGAKAALKSAANRETQRGRGRGQAPRRRPGRVPGAEGQAARGRRQRLPHPA
jgi:DNA-directed RNA polymerase subunit beta'